jgi:hypothetical protein
MKSNLLFLGTLVLMVVASANVKADYVFGDFEGSDPGTWGYWSGGVQTPIDADASLEVSTEDSSLNASSVKATNAGYDQNLAYGADFATREALSNATSFQFDVVMPQTANFDSGYWQIYELILNSPAGFTNVTSSITNSDGNGVNIYWGGAASGERRVVTFTVDYSAQAAAWVGVPGYTELIFSLNNDSVHTTAYIDHFRIVSAVPEPATLSLFGLSGIICLFTRKRS